MFHLSFGNLGVDQNVYKKPCLAGDPRSSNITSGNGETIKMTSDKHSQTLDVVKVMDVAIQVGELIEYIMLFNSEGQGLLKDTLIFVSS